VKYGSPVAATDESEPANGAVAIAEALARLEAVVRRRPEFARDTNRSTTTLTAGLRCVSEEGSWSLHTDMPPTIGGEGSAPTPGVLGRAALGSCLAIGYQLRAARLGVELTSIRVEIEADSDDAGMLFADADARPGYSAVRYHVEITTNVPDDVVAQILDEGDALSPYRDVFAGATPMTRTSTIRRPES
jgi:uncharacterized OsmC-like protein